MEHTDYSHKLLFAGILLFLVGLLTGFLIPLMATPRIGLSAHLEGVMNGLFLVALGLIWEKLVLTERVKRYTYLLALYGTFANFLAVLIAAITGGGKMMPLAGGKDGGNPSEMIISFLLITLSLAMVAVCVLVLVGLWKRFR